MEIQVDRDNNFLQSADGHLIIVQVRTRFISRWSADGHLIIL